MCVRASAGACACARACVRACGQVCVSESSHSRRGGWQPPRRAREWTAHTARRPPRVAQGCPTDHTAISTRGSRQCSRRRTQRPQACRPHPPPARPGRGSVWIDRRVRRASLRTAESPAESIAVTGTRCAGGWDLVARCNRYGARWRVGPR